MYPLLNNLDEVRSHWNDTPIYRDDILMFPVIPQTKCEMPDSGFVLQQSNNAMSPAIEEGSYCYIDPTRRKKKTGDLVAYSYSGHIVIGRLERLALNDYMDFENHKQERLNLKESVYLGAVVMCIKYEVASSKLDTTEPKQNKTMKSQNKSKIYHLIDGKRVYQ